MARIIQISPVRIYPANRRISTTMPSMPRRVQPGTNGV